VDSEINRAFEKERSALALESARGRATPLAHGLDQARQALRGALRHGRNLEGNSQFAAPVVTTAVMLAMVMLWDVAPSARTSWP
jgi:hypothetical protein